MKRKDGTRRRLSATASAVAAAALTAAAFAAFSVAQDSGSGNGTDQAQGPPVGGPGAFTMAVHPPSAKDRAAMEDFRSCMSDQGVDPPPQPGDGPPSPPSKEQRDKIEQAMKACADQLPDGAQALPMGPPPPCHGDKKGGGPEVFYGRSGDPAGTSQSN